MSRGPDARPPALCRSRPQCLHWDAGGLSPPITPPLKAPLTPAPAPPSHTKTWPEHGWPSPACPIQIQSRLASPRLLAGGACFALPARPCLPLLLHQPLLNLD